MPNTSEGTVREDHGALFAMQPARPRVFVVDFEAATGALTPASRERHW